MKDDNKLIERINKIRSRYKTEDTDQEEVQMSFIDELNDLIRGIFKDDPTDVYTALTPGELDKWRAKKFKRSILKFFRNITSIRAAYFILLACITGFLVSEAVGFYAIAGAVTAKTYFKAILTEVCFIFLSGYRAVGKIQTTLVSALRVGLFCLMLFVISSGVISSGVSNISQISKIQEKIELIEQQILEKDKAIEFYREKGWGVNMRSQLDEKDKLVAELLELKKQQIDGKNEEMSDQIKYETWGKAAFRVILLLISVLLTRRLFKF